MKKGTLLIFGILFSVVIYGQDPSDNKIPRKTESALPNEYPDGVYLMDSESDPNWSWPEDAGVVLGLKWATSNSRHSQLLIDRYARKMMIRAKNWGNNEWTAWNRVLVEYNGQIGVGTISPLANLDVRTSGKSGVIATFLSDEGISDGLAEHKWTIRTGRSFDYPNRTVDFGMVSDSYGQNPAFYVAPKGVEAFRITESGKVGIGTTDFSGNHKLRVEGSIGAREVKVEASGWSDFVFEQGYELRTLEALETHIQEQGHLPEIPSAAEVIEQGINLGEMNAKLLQKIEELTLYLIEQNKELKDAQAQILKLKEKVQTLENE